MFQKYMIWFCYAYTHMRFRTHNFEKSWTCVWHKLFAYFSFVLELWCIKFCSRCILSSNHNPCVRMCVYATYCKVIIMDGLYMVYTYLIFKYRKKKLIFFSFFGFLFFFCCCWFFLPSFKIVVKIITMLQMSAFPF